jgi:hypothetical protein
MLNRIARVATDPLKMIRTLAHLLRTKGIPPHQALADFLRFRSLIAAGHSDFYYCSLWDRTLPLEERLRTCSHTDRVRLQRRICTKAAEAAARDKARAAATLRAAGVPGPEVLAIVSTDGATARPGRMIRTRDEFDRLLAEPHPDGLVFKPASGTQGFDIRIFRTVGPDGLVQMTGEAWSADRLWEVLSSPPPIASYINVATDWLVERRTPPHPDLARLHGDTLGCVRMITVRFDDGTVGILNPNWKIPIGRTGVDNLLYDSRFAAVDVETGRAGPMIFQPTMTWEERHPETGATIEGTVLPDWEEAREVCRRAQLAFPEIRSLGFDVGFTANGPRIVECNVGWGVWSTQTAQRRGLVEGPFLRFLEELGAEDVIRRRARRL